MGVNPKVRSVLVGHANENDLIALLGARMTDNYGSGYGRKSRLQFMLDEISKVHHPAVPAIQPWGSLLPRVGRLWPRTLHSEVKRVTFRTYGARNSDHQNAEA